MDVAYGTASLKIISAKPEIGTDIFKFGTDTLHHRH